MLSIVPFSSTTVTFAGFSVSILRTNPVPNVSRSLTSSFSAAFFKEKAVKIKTAITAIYRNKSIVRPFFLVRYSTALFHIDILHSTP